MKLMLILALSLTLTSCAMSDWARTSTGGAVYEYEHTTDGEKCSLKITSARNVAGGDIEIGPNCELKSMADDAGGAVDALNKIADIANEVVR